MRLARKLTTVAAAALLFSATNSFAKETVSGGAGSNAAVSSDSPVAAFDNFKTSLANAEAAALWGSLPKTWQANLNGMAQMIGQKMPAATWDKGFSIVLRVGKLLETKSEIFAGMLAASAPDKTPADIQSSLKAAGELFSAIGKSDFAKIEKLKTIDLGVTAKNTGSELLKMLFSIKAFNDEIAKESGGKNLKESLLATKAELVSQEGDNAEIKITAPNGKVDTQKVVKVEGKWLFKEMADGYQKDFANSKQQLSMALDQMPQNQMQVMMVMGMVESVLTTFENAKTPEEVQIAVQQVAPMLGGLMMGGAMMGGGQQPVEINIEEPKKK